MKKRIVSVFVLACMMCLLLAGCQSADGGKVANESRSGVARVVAYYAEGTVVFVNRATGSRDSSLGSYSTGNYILRGSGTGFGIGVAGKETDTFVTNRHVVDDTSVSQLNWSTVLNEMASRFGSDTANQYAAYQEQYVPFVILERTAVYILLDDYALRDGVLDEDRAVECKVAYRGNDYEPDLAVLQTMDGEPVPGRVAMALLGPSDSVESGDKVYALGYPGSTDDANATVAASVDRVTVTDGIVSLHTQFNDGNVMTDSIQHTAQINHGNSGGPLINGNGAVVGINTWIYGQDLNTGDRMNSYSIEIKYVRDLLDDLRISYDVYRGKFSVSPAVIGAIAAVSVIVIAVVAVAVLRKPRPAAVPGQFAQAPVQPLAAPVIAGDTGLRAQGVAGQFAGRRFAIAGQLRIGRDPARNDLVYPAGSQGVSGVHCVLIADGSRLLLQDLGSTYGTFVGGNRLAANAPVELRAGDRFCLGSEQETFVIVRKGEM